MSAQLAVITDPGDAIPVRYSLTDREPCGPMSVYVAYGDPGEVLYVGQTCDVRRRLLEHRRTALWWQWITSVAVMEGYTRDEAASIERAVIEGVSPSGNTHYVRRRAPA